jgi:hypothetical protein
MDTRDQRIALSTAERHEIVEMYRSDPVICMCRRLLLNMVLSEGIVVNPRSSGGGVMTSEFKDMVSEHWVPFMHDLMDHLFMFGFAPWLPVTKPITTAVRAAKRRKVGSKTTVVVPTIPPLGTYAMETLVNQDYVQRIGFIPMLRTIHSGHGGADPRVRVIVATGSMPSMEDGTHRSTVATLLPQYRIMCHLFKGTLAADHQRSHPPLITQDAPGKPALNDTMAEEPFADPVEILDDMEDLRYRKSKSDMKALHEQRQLASNLNKRGNAMVNPFRPSSEVISLQQGYETNQYHVPDGMQVATQPPLPPVRTDLLDLERQRVNTVCGCFGIPDGFISSGGSSSNGSGGGSLGEVEQRHLMRTLTSLTNMLSTHLTEVYHDIYPKEHVEITLPITPFTDIASLVEIFHQGVISHNTAGKHLLRAAGLDTADLELQKDVYNLLFPKPVTTVADKKPTSTEPFT